MRKTVGCGEKVVEAIDLIWYGLKNEIAVNFFMKTVEKCRSFLCGVAGFYEEERGGCAGFKNHQLNWLFLPRHPCCNTPCVGYMYTLAVYYRVLYATFLFEEEIPYTVWSLSGSTLLISETSTLYYGVISATNNFL